MQIINNNYNNIQSNNIYNKNNALVSRPKIPVFGMTNQNASQQAMLRAIRKLIGIEQEKLFTLKKMEGILTIGYGKVDMEALRGDVLDLTSSTKGAEPTLQPLSPIEKMHIDAKKKSRAFDEFSQVLTHPDCTGEDILGILSRLEGTGKPIGIGKHEKADFLIQMIGTTKRIDDIEVLDKIYKYSAVQSKNQEYTNLPKEKVGGVIFEIVEAASEMTHDKKFFEKIWEEVYIDYRFRHGGSLMTHSKVFNHCMDNKEYSKALVAYSNVFDKAKESDSPINNFVDINEINRRAVEFAKKSDSEAFLKKVIDVNQNLDREPIKTEKDLEKLIDIIPRDDYKELPKSQPVKNIMIKKLKENLSIDNKTDLINRKIHNLTWHIVISGKYSNELDPELQTKLFEHLTKKYDIFFVSKIYAEIIKPELNNFATLNATAAKPALFNLDSNAHIVTMNRRYADYLIKNKTHDANYSEIIRTNAELPEVIGITPEQMKGLVKRCANECSDYRRSSGRSYMSIKDIYKNLREGEFKNYPQVVKAIQELESEG